MEGYPINLPKGRLRSPSTGPQPRSPSQPAAGPYAPEHSQDLHVFLLSLRTSEKHVNTSVSPPPRAPRHPGGLLQPARSTCPPTRGSSGGIQPACHSLFTAFSSDSNTPASCYHPPRSCRKQKKKKLGFEHQAWQSGYRKPWITPWHLRGLRKIRFPNEINPVPQTGLQGNKDTNSQGQQ